VDRSFKTVYSLDRRDHGQTHFCKLSTPVRHRRQRCQTKGKERPPETVKSKRPQYRKLAKPSAGKFHKKERNKKEPWELKVRTHEKVGNRYVLLSKKSPCKSDAGVTSMASKPTSSSGKPRRRRVGSRKKKEEGVRGTAGTAPAQEQQA